MIFHYNRRKDSRADNGQEPNQTVLKLSQLFDIASEEKHLHRCTATHSKADFSLMSHQIHEIWEIMLFQITIPNSFRALARTNLSLQY
jgi:hypothetical protein